MGFGQHTKADNTRRDAGYPVPRSEVKVGRLTMVEIMAGVEAADYIDAKISAHNEVTIRYNGGSLVCRLIGTNIVEINADATVVIDTGGWNTMSTRRHVVNFLNRHGFGISMWGDIKRGGNVLALYSNDGKDCTEIVFKNRVMFNQEGGFVTDMTDHKIPSLIGNGS